MHANRKRISWILGQCFCPDFKQIVSIRVKKLSKTNLSGVKAYWMVMELISGWGAVLKNAFTFLPTVEPPLSDRPKCKDWVIAYGRWSFTRIEPQGSLPRRGPETSTLWKIILWMQLRICVVPFCHLSSSYMLNNKANIARDQRMCQVHAYKRLEKMENR